MNLEEIIKFVVLLGAVGAVIQSGFSIYGSAKKYNLIPIDLFKLLHLFSFIFTVLALASIIYSAYIYAIVFFLISWTIDSYFFMTKIEKPSRFEIWTMIYQTNTLFMLLMLFLTTRIITLLDRVVSVIEKLPS